MTRESRNQYFQMVRNRYMSVLSQLSDEELSDGLEEMNEKFGDKDPLTFYDKFVVITAAHRKPLSLYK